MSSETIPEAPAPKAVTHKVRSKASAVKVAEPAMPPVAAAPPAAAPVVLTAIWLNKIKWDENGLVPVIAQEVKSGDVMMFAWMNRDALTKTVETGEAVYWSRSRKKLWHKGDESGHIQKVLDIRLDCDADVVLLKIEQIGGIACHTGRHSCFFQKFEGDAKLGGWQSVEPVLKNPESIYK
jgi:phosphoribosyl-AMP cyclohydrolase